MKQLFSILVLALTFTLNINAQSVEDNNSVSLDYIINVLQESRPDLFNPNNNIVLETVGPQSVVLHKQRAMNAMNAVVTPQSTYHYITPSKVITDNRSNNNCNCNNNSIVNSTTQALFDLSDNMFSGFKKKE